MTSVLLKHCGLGYLEWLSASLKSVKPLMVNWSLDPCGRWNGWLNLQHSYRKLGILLSLAWGRPGKQRPWGVLCPTGPSPLSLTQPDSCSVKQNNVQGLFTLGLNCSHLRGNGERSLEAELLWNLRRKIIIIAMGKKDFRKLFQTRTVLAESLAVEGPQL